MVICYSLNEPYIAFYDSVAMLLIVLITFSGRMSLTWRKIIFVATMYMLSVMLLYFMGAYGPGLLYLLATVMFVSLIYSSEVAYWCIGVNSAVVLAVALGMHLEVLRSSMVTMYTPGTWLAVACNQILLSILFVAAVQMLISGLSHTLETESRLKDQLKHEMQESKKLVKELTVKNKEMEQFAYIASHDLQEPLNSILGMVEVMKLPGTRKNPADFDKSLGYISKSVERLKLLIRGLLDYAHIGRQLEVEEVSCHDVIANVVSDLRSSIAESGAKVEIGNSIKQMNPIGVFALDFNQLFQNLISNAIKFRGASVEPVVCLDVVDDGDFFQFSVKDNGIGIGAEALEKIFVIFKRAHDNSTYQGTGIGLAFCKKIVELHGGTIWVESAPEQGSTFYFTIAKSIAN